MKTGSKLEVWSALQLCALIVAVTSVCVVMAVTVVEVSVAIATAVSGRLLVVVKCGEILRI
jgi:hypothetical protein